MGLPCILSPTRITVTSATLIDNVFINDSGLKFDSVILSNEISDHFPKIVKVKFTAKM